MDFEMRDYVDGKTGMWDFAIKNGMLQTVDHSTAEKQRAIVATFIQRGTVPNLESFGVQWAELLTNQVSPQQINAQVRESISSVVDGMKFMPKYSMKDGRLVVEVKAASNG